jgi:hypothetical protein
VAVEPAIPDAAVNKTFVAEPVYESAVMVIPAAVAETLYVPPPALTENAVEVETCAYRDKVAPTVTVATCATPLLESLNTKPVEDLAVVCPVATTDDTCETAVVAVSTATNNEPFRAPEVAALLVPPAPT